MVKKPKLTLEDKKMDLELSNLYLNRYKRFEEVFPGGWSKKELKKFTGSTIHATEVQKLLDAGCPPELVSKILL